jgi:hypothetical protein
VFGASGNVRNARRDAATLAYACSVAGPGQLDEMGVPLAMSLALIQP